jgi:hypothetical protein
VPTEDDQSSVNVTGRPVQIVLPPAPPPNTLPPTGGDARSPVTAAGWLLLGGVGLVLLATRRRVRSAS